MSADLAFQKALRARLVATAAVTALVPAAAILDRNQRPAPSPSIVLGESQTVDEGNSIERVVTRIYHTVHIWKKEPSLEGVKAIAGAIRGTVHAGGIVIDSGFHLADCFVSGERFMRDPDGETSHGVVTVEALVKEVA